VPRDGKSWYFLEDMYPAYGNLVPRDIATRAIHKVVYDMHLGVDGQPIVYLDVSHIPADVSRRKLVNFCRQEHPVVASQLSQCGGAGTGCWDSR